MMIVANLATYPAREASLKLAVAQLSPQVNKLNIVLNEYLAIPEWIKEYGNVYPVIPDIDYKDIGKFLPSVQPDDIVILADDDLGYPVDYINRLVHEAKEAGLLNNRGGIGGLHGTIYTSVFQDLSFKTLLRVAAFGSWRVGSFRKNFNYWESLSENTRVDQIGTGTAIMIGSMMPPMSFMETGRRRADVRLAQWAFEKKTPIVALRRGQNWLEPTEQDQSIYAAYTRRMPKELSMEISTFAFKNPLSGKKWDRKGYD